MFVDVNVDPDEAAEAAATFLPLVDAVARCQAAGRFADDEAWGPSIELWAFAHGLVTLTLGGMLIVSDLFRHLESGLAASFVGYGDEPEAVGRSVRTAYCRIAPAGGFPSVTTKGTDLATLLSQVRR
jgi:hypothetical protein